MNPDQLQLRDISPPIPPQIHPIVQLLEDKNSIVLIAGIVLCVLVVAYFAFRFGKKKGALPLAHETALADLLRARRLMGPELALQYAGELSGILRSYIEKRFRIKTTRKTTKEFFTGLTGNASNYSMFLEEYRDSLEECLEQCDMAKFACCTPDQKSMEKMETAVQDFIEATRENREGGK